LNQELFNPSDIMELARESGLFVSLCTLRYPTPGEAGVGPSGAPLGGYIDVPGLVDIPCMDAPQPPSDVRIAGEEVRSSTDNLVLEKRHVLLDDYYPSVIDGWRVGWIAVVDGVIYDMTAAECDSQRTQVRLELQLATAGAVQA
jgi:hypothetical protein